jgi:hypothetical protein
MEKKEIFSQYQRMEQGISQVELAKAIRVHEMMVVNREIKAKVPGLRVVRDRLIRAVPGAAGFV